MGRLAVEASFEASLRHLGVDSVDAVLAHRWVDWFRGSGGVAQALQGLKESGRATVVGASLSTPGELIEALDDPRLGYVQIPFNLLDRRWLDPEVQAALEARSDVIVTVRSVFLQGLLAQPEPVGWPSVGSFDSQRARTQIAASVADLGRASPADLALAYVRGHGFVTSVVLGAETGEQVASQAGMFASRPLTGAQIDRVHQLIWPGSDDIVNPTLWPR